MLYRRTCVLLEDSRESGVTTSLGAERPTHFLCTHGLDLGDDEEEVGRWAKRSFEELGRDVDGWVRTRVFRVLDYSVVGTAVEKAQPVSPYFVVHGASHDERLVVRCVDPSVCRVHVSSCGFEPDVQRGGG